MNDYDVINQGDYMKDNEFNRSVCFTFFRSYLEQAELIAKEYGKDAGYDSMVAIVRYALFKEEPDGILPKIVVSGLKDAIDAGQEKRSKGFKGEDVEMTNKIIKYKEDNPNASYQTIATALGCSKSKVGKVLTPLNSSSNINSNSYSYSYSNSVDVDVDDHKTPGQSAALKDKEEEEECEEDACTNRGRLRGRGRTLDELTNSELDCVIKDYKSKMKYQDIYKKYNLKQNVLSKNVLKDISLIKKNRKKKSDVSVTSSSLGLTSSECYELAKYFGTTIDGVPVCMDIIKDNVDVDAASSLAASDLLGLLRCGDYNLDVANPDFSVIARDWQSRCVDAVVGAEADIEVDVG